VAQVVVVDKSKVVPQELLDKVTQAVLVEATQVVVVEAQLL
jgi:hypothetical protein